MTSQPLPPNPCLIAILLVVKTTEDPCVAFHYPPRPGEDNSPFKGIFGDDDEESTSSTDNESQDSATDAPEPNRTDVVQNGDSPPDVDDNGSLSPEKNGGFVQSGSQKHWNDLFGYKSGFLARLLCPAVSCHKKRFEVGLHDSVFIGWPVFPKPGATWKKARRPRRSSSRSKVTAEKVKRRPKELEENKLQNISGTDDSDAPRSSVAVESQWEADQDKELQEEQETLTLVSKKKAKAIEKPSNINTVISKEERPLVMFNVVFVLRPPPLEYHIRVREMYDNVVKKLGKALRLEQMQSGFVANEIALIASLIEPMNSLGGSKPSLSTLYHNLISQSSLAKGISTLYNSIASSRIAHVSLTPSSSLSLQIPLATSITMLPSPLEPQLPGLWLTTANSMPTDDDAQTPQLGSHFTLLLLSDMRSILSDITAAASPIAKPLTHYLRVTSPLKSFSQISQSSGITLSDIQFLASHLIYWRRARAIPPLHQRDTYITSPNADMRKLASATSAFAKAFPALPPLPKILSLLSSTPRPYANIMPSKDHKPAYMDILAWLMRENLVTQLRTFAWVRVPSHIKETVTKHQASTTSEKPPLHTTIDDSDDASTSSLGVPDSISSSRLTVPPSNPVSPASSTHTTLPFPQNVPHHSPFLIPNPRLASALPSRYLSAISEHVLETQGEESQSAWDKCVRYFDGKHAMETIPVREGWKRKKVAALLTGWEELGIVVRGRHW